MPAIGQNQVLLCIYDAKLSRRFNFGPPAEEGPIRYPPYVCMYVCLYVCMYVTKINFVNFFKIGSYNFFETLHDERGHQYLSNGESPMSIDALVAPFWAQ